MHFNAGSLAFLSITVFSSLASAQTIAYGQELQNGDQTNHWVVWIDGEHACPGQQVLSVLTENPCDQSFNFGEVQYTFAGCAATGGAAPTNILDSSGIQIGGCSTSGRHKIHCSGDDHDIIKHGLCTIVTGA